MNNFVKDLKDFFDVQEQQFGRGEFYQSLPELGIEGQRSTSKRYEIYGLNDIISAKSKVLDIGCNCGFFSLTVAKKAKSVLSIEPNPVLVQVAEKVKKHLKRDNCKFRNVAYNDYEKEDKFNVILSFAVHHWIQCPLIKYVQDLSNMLEDDGLIVLESHAVRTFDRFFMTKVKAFEKMGFQIIKKGEVDDDVSMKRIFVILQKKQTLSEISSIDYFEAKLWAITGVAGGHLFNFLARCRLI